MNATHEQHVALTLLGWTMDSAGDYELVRDGDMLWLVLTVSGPWATHFSSRRRRGDDPVALAVAAMRDKGWLT